MFLEAHRLSLHGRVTARRTAKDFAFCMLGLVNTHYSGAVLIRVVLDNPSNHTAAALYETTPPPRRTASCDD